MSNNHEPNSNALGAIASGVDAARGAITAAGVQIDQPNAGPNSLPKAIKVGNLATALEVGHHINSGNYADASQSIGVAAASSLVGGATVAVAVGFAPLSLAVLGGALVAYGVGRLLDKAIDKIQDNPQWLDPLFPDPNSPNSNNGQPPSRDYRIEYYDPLILDLNGDGIIGTVTINKFQGAVFDGDNDGLKTATGWVSPEDGLLVRDINNDGIINSGAELFGDSTKLANGTNAQNGFSALSDLDSNGDGKVDNNDANFNELKVWKDTNGDGVSQTTELFTLNEVGIESLNTGISSIDNQQVDGGYIAETGSYTKIDGSIGKMADVNFEKNDFYSKYINQTTVTEDVAALPQLKGYGRLQDLHQAAMQSTEFKELLSQYATATTRFQQKELLDELIMAWAKSDPSYSSDSIEIFRLSHVTWVSSSDSDNVIYVRRGDPIPAYLTMPPPPSEIADATLTAKIRFVDALLGKEPTTQLNQYSTDQISNVNQVYDLMKESIYFDLLNQTILKSYLDSIDMYLGLEKDEMYFDFSNLEQLLSQKILQSPLTALEDLKDLLKINGKFLDIAGWENGFVLLQQWRDELSDDPTLKIVIDQIFSDMDVQSNNGTNDNDYTMITESPNSIFNAGNGDDIVVIGTETGLTVNVGNGDDVIVSGKGNDFLNGGDGNNTYILSKGTGKDIINYENTSSGTDKVAFAEISIDEVVFYQLNHNLVIQFGTDEVTLLGALDSTSTKNISFRFSDQVISLSSILEMPLQNLSSFSNELYINGWRGTDVLTGTNADNQIYAFDGSDTLIGGKGNDRLYGGNGQDNYVLQSGDGIDEIYEPDFSTEQNILNFQDINPSDISKITFEGNDLIIQYGVADKIILKNYVHNSQNSALLIQFSDQTIWQNSDLMSRVTE
ncbi:hypothetical protein [Acinetobacter sp. WZC-1]|uniref:hypothetical protein n=1 Tax=Acinetobacter sp. WZC-1 TaxID=3459034 RepID=UPI00403D5A84